MLTTTIDVIGIHTVTESLLNNMSPGSLPNQARGESPLGSTISTNPMTTSATPPMIQIRLNSIAQLPIPTLSDTEELTRVLLPDLSASYPPAVSFLLTTSKQEPPNVNFS
jgi:hypothetical protein